MKVSVCMATYNGEQYIEQQLRSILRQLHEADEVIVSDDDSTDATCAIVESLHDPRIVLLHAHEHNFKWNFQNALQHASGDLIFLADQDDVWLDGKYERCVHELEQYDLVVTNSIMTDEHLNPICNSFFDYYRSGRGVIKNAIRNTYFGSCMAFRRCVLEQALPFPQTQEIGHDIWIGLVADMTGKVLFMEQPYLYYRRHTTMLTNVTGSFLTRSPRPFWTKVKSRWVVLTNVLKFYIQHYAR